MKHKYLSAFTLVELIVVITILAILGTIAFVSFQGFSADARDTRRISDVANLHRTLDLELTKGYLIPAPINSVEVTGNGSIFTIQGDFDQNEVGKIGLFGDITDPLTGLTYPYATDESRTKYQISAITESKTNTTSAFIPQTYAQDFAGLFTKGDKLGIVLESGSLTPVHRNTTIQTAGSFEILTETGGAYDVYLGQNEVLSGTKEEIRGMNPRANCKRLQELGYIDTTGEYSINPNGEEVDAYCHEDHKGITFYQSIEDGDFENPTSSNWEGTHVSKVDDGTGNIVAQVSDHPGAITSNNFTYIKPGKRYRLSGDFKSVGSVNSKMHYGFAEYDENFNFIRYETVAVLEGSDTVLTEAVLPTDTTITFEDIGGTMCQTWQNSPKFGTLASIAFETDPSGTYGDLPNRNLSLYKHLGGGIYTAFTDMVDNGDTCTATFHKAIGFDYPAGTNIRMQYGGASYNYRVLSHTTIPDMWSSYSGDIFGIAQLGGEFDHFRPGTKFIKILLLTNYNQGGQGATIQFDNLKLEEID